MREFKSKEVNEIVKSLGGEAEDGTNWQVLLDAQLEIVLKYVSLEHYNARLEAMEDEPTAEAWILEHVVIPDHEAIKARMIRRPMLKSRMINAIYMLYGAAEEFNLGKAGF